MRRGAGLFRLPDRGILRVTGGDRVRWLEGMISNEVGRLAPGPDASGCYALLLTPQGRILADLHVLLRPEAFWLELEGGAVGAVHARLERYVIADDVALSDESAGWARFALEGRDAPAIAAAACGRPLNLAADACLDVALAGCEAVVAAWGVSGLPALQWFVPTDAAERVEAALREAGGARLVAGDPEVLETLRIEAGVPRLGAELGEDVLPAEAGLVERAVCLTKGCYTGQEIVARLESRGRVGHRLVGLRFEGSPAPSGTALEDESGRRVGEITSACVSADAGAIALGFVRSGHEAPGTRLRGAGRTVRVAPLPCVRVEAGAEAG